VTDAQTDQSDIKSLEAGLYMQTGRRMPITLVRGEGTHVFDDQGKAYLDFVAGIATNSLGHAHPGLADVIAHQARTLIHVSNIFYTEPQIELASLLIEHSVFDRVFFSNSGAEANEAAIKIARKWGNLHRNGAFEIIVMNDGFHGRTMSTVSATGTARYREPFEPVTPGFVFVPFDDLAAVRAATTERTAAVMVEPVQGEGGVNVPDPGYLPGLRQWCDDQGLLLVFDEIQTGSGRTGSLWAYEQAGVEPDVMTLAKGIAGGVPLGATLAKEHAAVFEPGDHGSTFGGNPLATAAGAYVIRQLVESDVLANVRARADQLSRRLQSLEDRSPLVSGEAGAGLLRRLELSQDIAGDVVTRAAERGLLLNPVRPNRVRFMPPLTVSAEEIDEAVDIVESVLDDLGA
jgi:acetylornithine aminotransferase/acetylornithine/N-succinyldiaminopimelate aminotransferase